MDKKDKTHIGQPANPSTDVGWIRPSPSKIPSKKLEGPLRQGDTRREGIEAP